MCVLWWWFDGLPSIFDLAVGFELDQSSVNSVQFVEASPINRVLLLLLLQREARRVQREREKCTVLPLINFQHH